MQNNKYIEHHPIMLNEILEFLYQANFEDKECLFADLTFGFGGHSVEILKKFPKCKLIAFDQDIEAYENGLKRLGDLNLSSRCEFYHQNFSSFKSAFLQNSKFFNEFKGFDFILMDIGVSSHHFDKKERGFSFKERAPLDMRMDTTSDTLTAKDIINDFSEDELNDIFIKLGEEKFSRRIAKNIVEKRKDEAIEYTDQLENIIFHSYPKKFRYGRIHPATKVFQALRIFVNNELGVLEDGLPEIFNLLIKDGILQVITFHSLEDRIVKSYFKKVHKEEKTGTILTKKVISPTKEEIADNKRARSAKLRVIRKI